MGRRLEEIEGRAAEVVRRQRAEWMRDARIAQAVAKVRAEHAADLPAGLAPLLEKAGLTSADVQAYYDAQQARSERLREAIVPLLQLTDAQTADLLQLRRQRMLLSPWIQPQRLPVYTVFTAVACEAFIVSETPTQHCHVECAPSRGRNTCNAKLMLPGEAESCTYERLECLWVFEIPPRPATAVVTVQVTMSFHGWYYLEAGAGHSLALMNAYARGFQYGVVWGDAWRELFQVSGTTQGRHDEDVILSFTMPTGADPIEVAVVALIAGEAVGAGTIAEVDFSSGDGNFIDVVSVATFEG